MANLIRRHRKAYYAAVSSITRVAERALEASESQTNFQSHPEIAVAVNHEIICKGDESRRLRLVRHLSFSEIQEPESHPFKLPKSLKSFRGRRRQLGDQWCYNWRLCAISTSDSLLRATRRV